MYFLPETMGGLKNMSTHPNLDEKKSAQQIGRSWMLPPQQESSASIERCLDDELLTACKKFAQILHVTRGKNGGNKGGWLWRENEVKTYISFLSCWNWNDQQ